MAAEPVKEFFSMGDVCGLTDLKPHVLRYWEEEFSALRPKKTRGAHRHYVAAVNLLATESCGPARTVMC